MRAEYAWAAAFRSKAKAGTLATLSRATRAMEGDAFIGWNLSTRDAGASRPAAPGPGRWQKWAGWFVGRTWQAARSVVHATACRHCGGISVTTHSDTASGMG
ncbi:hypothetical protein GCM10027398_44540 [Azotobacter salinestris]